VAGAAHVRRTGRLPTLPGTLLLVTLLLVTWLLVTWGSPAVAAAAGASGSGGLADASNQARIAASQVDALTAEYRRHSQRVAAALTAFAASFSAGVAAADQQDRSLAAVQAAGAAQTRTVRAIYASGGAVALTSSVLGAGSVDDVLWRLNTTHRLLADLLQHRHDDLLTARQTAAAAAARAQLAAAGQQVRAFDLAEVQAEQDRADAALAQARATLSRLDRRVAGMRAARAAAARLAAAAAAANRLAHTLPSPGASAIPPEFATAYHAAAPTCPGLSWTLLAAVGQVESGHGRNDGPSSAGAIGPMQFMPATFASYAVDGDHDGRTDPWDPEDAIFTAARYLCSAGAGQGPAGVQRALFTYNHAQWYVDLVLGAQRSIQSRYGS
jgi:hypothetical protein